MGHQKELTEDQKGAILYGYQHGHSCRKIAETVNCGASAVSACLRRYKATGSTDTKPRSGRPRLLETPDRNRLKRLVIKNEKTRRLCVGAIQGLWEKKTNQKVSTPTLRRTLHITGLGNRAARQKPFISPDNMVKRLAWARSHQRWTVKDWEKVLWSDESTFTQFQQVHNRLWREPSEEWSTTCVSATVKHSPSRMFWGCFSAKGVGPIIPLVGSVTGDTYLKTMSKYVIPTMRRHFPKGDGWFQDDNARPHRSKIVVAFQKKKIFVSSLGRPKVRTLTQSRTSGLKSNEEFIMTGLPACLHSNDVSKELGSRSSQKRSQILLKVCRDELRP
jgi:transposase